MAAARAQVLVVALACLALLAGCGGGGPSGETLLKASQKTLGANTVSVDYTAVATVPGAKRAIRFAGTGTLDNAQARTRVTDDLSTLFTAAGIKASKTQFRGEELIDNSAGLIVYFRFPYFSARAKPMRPWVRVDLGGTIRVQGASLALLAFDQNPWQYLYFLQSPNGKVTKVGTDAAGTTHYKASLDLLNYPKNLPAASRNVAEFFASQFTKLLTQRYLPSEVWIDKAGYVRELTITYPIPIGIKVLNYTLTIHYSGFGKPASVSLPPDSQVVNVASLTRLLGGAG